jgi:hypothetical protein
MPTDQSSLKPAAHIAVAALGVLLLGAFIFFKERVFFADTSFLAQTIINDRHLNILEKRYGSFITQIVPYIGANLHLPLTLVLVAYAVSFNLFYFTVAAIIVYRYKQYMLGILMSLYYFLIVSDSFFHANDEIHQGIAWMFLFFAVTIHAGGRRQSLLFIFLPFLLLAFLAISSHFLAIVPTAFLWIYFIIEKKGWPYPKKQTLLLSILLIVIVALKFWLSRSLEYENNNLHNVTHVSLKDIYMAFTKPVVYMFFYRCIFNYWLAIAVFIISIVSLVKSKQKALLAWTLLSFIGYIILIGLAFGDLDKDFSLYYVETEWESIGIIISAPFVFTFLPKINASRASALLIIIFAVRLIYISTAIPEFHWRLKFKENVLAQMRKKHIPKLALYTDDYYRTKCIQSWSFEFETIMESAIDGDKPQLTFFFVNRDDQKTLNNIKSPNGFYNGWSVCPQSQLNPRYFSIDTTRPYTVMSYGDLMK